MAEYIDRQAVNNLLYNVYSREVYTHEGTVQKVTGEIDVNELNSIPTADVRENVKGEWEHLGGDEWLCSSCGYVVSTEGSWEHPLECGRKFCENCGADLRGKHNDG